MNDRQIFVENLNYYLEKSGKLQRDLAEYVGARYTTVSGWTRGISYPRADAMEKIANFFGVPTSQLVGPRTPAKGLSQDEIRLVDAYRAADPIYRRVALEMLEEHPLLKKDAK